MIYNTWHYATKTIKDIMQPQPSANCDGCLKLNWSVSKIYEIRKTSRIPKQRHKILTCRCRYIVSHHVMATFCGPSCKPQAFKESGFEQQMIILYSYIHIFMYIHIFLYAYDIVWTWKTSEQMNAGKKRQMESGYVLENMENIFKTFVHMKKMTRMTCLILFHLAQDCRNAETGWNKRNVMNDDEVMNVNLSTNTKASRRSRRFLLVVRIKVQPTQQEAEDANLRVSFWLVLTLPNVQFWHRNFNRTLIRIA